MINDNLTRRAMDNLLKTWKEPVPGSMDHRPVFSPDIVRPIENALIQWKTAVLQKQRQTQPNTPTPPNTVAPQAVAYGGLAGNFNMASNAFSPPPPSPNIAVLQADISSLVTRLHTQFAASPYDTDVQNKLKTVLQLQTMVSNGSVADASLHAVRSSVTAFAAGLAPQVQAPAPRWQPPVQSTMQFPQSAADLLTSLAKSGVLGNIPKPIVPVPASTPLPLAVSTASLLQSLQSILPVPPIPSNIPSSAPAAPLRCTKPRIPFSSAALKQFRPELVRSLYDDQPNQCSTCGRRFLATEDGRAKKSRHLDWHFRTNQRMADPNTGRGQHRNWFVDEMEWIRLTDFDPSTTTADAVAAVTAAKKEKGPQDQYVRAPAGVTSHTCSICQEEMRSSYSEELQDWVFMNAAMYNGKIAHATCGEEIRKSTMQPLATAAALGSVDGQRQRSATPDSMLGKRKAEGLLVGNGARVKMG